ncbi:major facilitator superfamily transporter [Colletotrichum graminicola]|uniref:Major facilitator superfamily transporter n=1 Tax=Colletotrichum graminicola (strain M1.001 / M2 / FGSC 10212) TaxID=645133 RepID=E3QFN0_COLGM|nr:major facilitator superfamily transporter [Colletotrichum graminicola M1.001]EFQ29668.1 major facilitator superfamily transporter [Colletotrichum graminicola M1.001]WDK23668.1 major facilitator superfamily transporter [Colletotrichum graminicola]
MSEKQVATQREQGGHHFPISNNIPSSQSHDAETDTGRAPTARTSRSNNGINSHLNLVIDPPPDGGLRAWMVVLGTFLATMNTWGVANSFGVFQPYFTSLFSRSPSDVSWIGSFEVFLLFFVGTFTGRWTDMGYFRALFVAGFMLVVLGMLAASFCTTYWQFFLAQGICLGLGNGCLFCPCMAVTSTYFAKRRSLAFGITAAGAVAGGLAFPSMVRQLLPQIGLGWTIRSIALIQLVTLVMAGLLMKTRIPPRRAAPLVEWAAFKESEYSFYAAGAFMCFWGTYFAFHYLAAFSRDIMGLSYTESLDLLLVLNGVGAIGRIIPAQIGDVIGTINIFAPMALMTGTIMYCWAGVHSITGLYFWSVFYGISVGGVQSLFPSVLSSLTTDPQKQGTRMGMVFTVVSFASLTGSPIAGAIIDAMGGRYAGAQAFAGSCMILGMIFVLSARVCKTRKMGVGAFAWIKV